MAVYHKGKFYILFLLFVSSFPLKFAYPEPVSAGTDIDAPNLLNQHEIQLKKLEEIVIKLNELVSRLDSQSLGCSDVGFLDEKKQIIIDKKSTEIDLEKSKNGMLNEKTEEKGLEGRGAVAVAMYNTFWSERFQFVSAVKLDSDPMAINVLPFRDYEGFNKYVAVGDDRGRVYVFLRNGEVLVEFYTGSNSPITALLSYVSFYKNESMVITGHENGLISMHRVWEVSNGEEWSSLSMENVGRFASLDVGEEGSAIKLLEVHHVGRKRYILSTDNVGKIKVFRDNGTIYGLAVPTSRPLVFLKQRLMFLTETGAGSLDLRTMKVRESECEGLNQSVVKNYVVDIAERSKAYGYTSEGDLIHVLLVGDIMNFKCRVRSKKKFDINEPLALHAINGYLVIINQEKIFLYNVSSPHYARIGGPRLLFSAELNEIRSSFLNNRLIDVARKGIPVIGSDHEKLVVIGFGSGYIGMYRSNLPAFKGEYSTILWTSPVIFFVLFLFGAWQFFAKKKESLSLWGPDEPFSLNGAPTVDSSSRYAVTMDSRGGDLRGPSRRYVSSSAFPGSFRPTSVETNSRPISTDPNFRTNSELKFRGSNIESTNFPKRREG